MCRSKWKGNFFSFNFYNTFFNSKSLSHTIYQKNIVINKKLISYTFLLDFDVDESIVEAGNSGNIILKPVLRASIEEETGAIIGTVVATEDVQVEVSTDLNGEAVSTYVNQDDGSFALVGLLEGNYDVIFTPDPDSGLEVVVIGDVNVTLGNVTDIGEISFE